MRRLVFIFAGIVMLPFLAIAIGGGCNSTAPTTSTPKSPDTSQSSSPVTGTSDPKIAAALAALSTEDRALVLKQKICPVSGEALGSMGAPIKLDVKGRAVFICCEGCREQLLAKPDEYLPKIDQ